ncbi:hypothetical protein TUN199_03729 [Pyrenophora tritici-repentis]|uniref:Uncharacterized protein n=1 Tax=Pyrenophora tritici-repentis TaxID=45151 RepID=A0A5M9KUD4_9PLEO|nr:hypothetical protein PtrV1_11544 [Pyrenophora tritici-repentis]KAF7444347.1 hypothetical protein A1F99_109000 [Pyrenophora tritici-repentis]KAF7565001.1 hypothetical protein PtrM4_044350 [Pyrenophora tritici-repentis]KAI0582286.1 hypothetical protein Alg215_04218 [Pyrenophora tritici-repentis]KAI0585401.1 hypothetical protein Alg130_04769 [Pyrenophora tritici-repentis]
MKTPTLFLTTLLVGIITPVALAQRPVVGTCYSDHRTCTGATCSDDSSKCRFLSNICGPAGLCLDGACGGTGATRTCHVQCGCTDCCP